MKKINIWKNNEPLLETHTDDRGVISDVFYDSDIHHVAMINSKKEITRGDHYHKETTQYTLVLKGKLEYWFREIESNQKAKCIIMNEGDMIESPPLVIHSFRFLTDNQIIVFTKGKRGGKDYEKDTFRINTSIIGEI